VAERLSEEEVKNEATTSDPESAKKKGMFIYPTHPLNIISEWSNFSSPLCYTGIEILVTVEWFY